MKQTVVQVDAFTNRPFQGNPAAVCILNTPQSDSWMQLVAREMNLSETAFLLKKDDGYSLRWFTPTIEVPLCGHATLASAHVLWTEEYLATEEIIQFQTLSGLLTASFKDDWIKLDFPVNLSAAVATPAGLETALGVKAIATYSNSLGYLVEVESASIVKALQPNFSLLKTISPGKFIVTSLANRDSEYDFVSRFFAPGLGIDEDPVTGAAHCCLAPFWHARLNQDEFLAYQASSRGGVLKINYPGGERVFLRGQAVTVMRGQLIF